MTGLYKDAGVDIDAASSWVKRIKDIADSTKSSQTLSGVGGFSGLFHLGASGYKDPVLSVGADGVGTKVMLAQAMGKHDSVGIDLVAMNADDVVTSGATPLLFLDYISIGRLEPEIIESIIKGIAQGCRMAGCVLLGGETAQMPDMYGPGEYDLAGFCVGVVEKENIIDGKNIVPGDVLVGLESSGVHSNGYTLIRKVVLEKSGINPDAYIPEFQRTLGEELLEPTRIYAPTILDLSKDYRVKGIAHITGGGILGNVSRLLPQGTSIELFHNWKIPPVFRFVADTGNIPDEEMLRVFNMGIGMIVIVDPRVADSVIRRLSALGVTAYEMGVVTENRQEGIHS